MVLDGDIFILNHASDGYVSGTYVIKKENANKLPEELQRDLALPKDNTATVQTPTTIKQAHQVLEGTAKDQSNTNWAYPHATGGGQQTVVDPKATNRNEIFGE